MGTDDRNIRVYTANTLDEFLARIKSVQAELGADTQVPHLWYRGHANADWELMPSIHSKLKAKNPDDFFETERGLNNDFQSRASVFFETKPPLDDFSSWLTLMQHYSFPTRLLDWTRSPLFALFFATRREPESDSSDACVWIMQPLLLNKIANLESDGRAYIYHMEHNVIRELIYPAFKRVTTYHIESFSEQRKYEENHERYTSQFTDKIAACYATQRDLRVFNQQSVFTVHNSLRCLGDIHEDILLESDSVADNLLFKVVIPADSKTKVFDSLYDIGITHSVVFPDLAHVALDVLKLYGIE